METQRIRGKKPMGKPMVFLQGIRFDLAMASTYRPHGPCAALVAARARPLVEHRVGWASPAASWPTFGGAPPTLVTGAVRNSG